jgi:hypothetical protein
MIRHPTIDQKAEFTRNMRNFWAEHGLRAIDRAVIILIPTLIFAPAYVGWLS